MIKNINAKGLKGLEFSHDLGQKTIIIGPNGSGKTSIATAGILAVNGYYPGTGKTNPDILAAFGKDKLNVGIKINGTALNRQWSKSSKGSVNQTYLVDTRKSGKDAFISALAEAGNPKIFDLSLFMDLSDQKKIDYLFNLFPPAGDVSELDDQITDLSEKLNQKRADIRVSENFVSKTMANRAQIELPSGTLAETSGEIKSLENELSQARDQLKKAEIEVEKKQEADRLAKEQAEKEVRDRRQREQEAEHTKFKQKQLAEREKQVEAREQAVESKPSITPEQFPEIASGIPPGGNGAAESIQKIIDAIESVGCPICSNGAAKMVARVELNKYLRKEAA